MANFKQMKPREVEAYLRQRILDLFGDKVENKSLVMAAHGYYTVHVRLGQNCWAKFDFFRKTEVPKILAALRALR